MPKLLKSKAFINKVLDMTPAQQADVEKTIGFIMADPDNKDFKRYYLTPYLQAHLLQDKQYTIYFEVRDNRQTIYCVWINDDTCLHDTRGNVEDPDLKEFDRLRKAGELEAFNKDFHEG